MKRQRGQSASNARSMNVNLGVRVTPMDLSKLRVFPLAERKSLTRVDEILIEPDAPLKPCTEQTASLVEDAARKIVAARARGAAVMLIYGAHLLRNGAPWFSSG